MKNCLVYETQGLHPANSALPQAHVEREAQATCPPAKKGQPTTLLGRLHPGGGTLSELGCISVVMQQYGQIPDGWIMMLTQV